MHEFWPKKQEFLLFPENSHACLKNMKLFYYQILQMLKVVQAWQASNQMFLSNLKQMCGFQYARF